MNRRDFLKAVFSTAIYYSIKKILPAEQISEYDVGIVRGKNYEKAVIEAVNLVGGIQKYVKPGDTVVVKPNIAFNSPPHLKATTDPLIVRTVVHLCFQALASKVYVFDRTVNNSRLTYVTSGIEEAALSAGAKVLHVDNVTDKIYKPIGIKDAFFLKETTVNRYILESDVLINVPVAKHHSSAGLTIGMKNLMGITGDNRSKWHWNLHETISDINMAIKSHLTIIDATNIMLRNGPTGGSTEFLKRLDTIVASGNVVCADSETTTLFGIKPAQVEYLEFAHQKSIGKIEGYSRKSLTL